MMAAFVAVVLLAGGGACGARQAWLRGQRQEYAEQGLAYLESQDYAQAVTALMTPCAGSWPHRCL